jgi:hypothetical protein
MTIDEAIKHCEEVAERKEASYKADLALGLGTNDCKECAKEHRQLAEWLKELKTYREFADWLANAVLEEDWEDSFDFNTEVICRKLTKLGKLKVADNKYMKVNADDNN